MKLHEFQAKALFAAHQIPIPAGQVADTPAQAAEIADGLGGNRWVVKAQVHAGGRGKGGGVAVVNTLDTVHEAAAAMLGRNLVTPQTDVEGLPIHQVLVEAATAYRAELYLGLLVDRAAERVVFMASAAGGMDIEEVAARTPEKILSVHVDPVVGLQGYQCRRIGFGLGLAADQVRQLTGIMTGLYRLFTDKDASLVEINPLVITEAGDLLALDAKINLDDNALYRQKALAALRDASQEDEKERIAVAHQLNYVTLDGSIGCMVNGAGLAMATMDLIKLHGGEPANFLDVGGGVTAERVAEAFKLILSDDQVRAILVNIFGGIVRCDLIAEGIIQAVQSVDVGVPVVVRLEGTNADQGRQLLAESGMNITAAADLTDAARKVVAAAQAV